MPKILLSLLTFLTFAAACPAAAQLELPGRTPIFTEPNHRSKLVGVTGQPLRVEEIGTRTTLVSIHPLARYHRFTEVRLPDGKTGFVDPKITLTERGTLHSGNAVEWWRYCLLPLFMAALGATAFSLWKKRDVEDRLRWLKLALIPVFLRQLLLLLLVNQAQNLITSPADEGGYYSNLTSFLAWDFSVPWHFTVGTSIFYLPFELFSGTRELIDIFIPVSWVEGFIISPCSLFLGFLIARKLTGSVKIAFGAMLTWAVLPFIYHHLPEFEPRYFSSFFAEPSWAFTYRHYINLIACGFSAMSDTPSTMLMLLVMVLLLYRRATWHNVALAAFLYAFGCMFRINNIIFAPALAVMLWCYRPEYLDTPRRFLRNGLVGLAAFLIGFMPQFLANWYFFDNPLRFSYTNYAHGAHTYIHWMFVELTSAFYGTTNQVIWIPALLSLFFMRDRKLRITLTWWAVPIILFFFGYSHGTDDPIRFILTSYPAFFIAIAACGIWKNVERRDLPFLLLIALGWYLTIPNPTTANYSFYLEQPLHLVMRNCDFVWFDIGGFLCIVTGVAVLTWRNRQTGVFLALVNLLYLLGNAYILALMLVAALLRAIFDTAVMLTPGLRRQAPLPPGNDGTPPAPPSRPLHAER